MTKDNGDSYSIIISLKGMRLALLSGETNGLKPKVADVGKPIQKKRFVLELVLLLVTWKAILELL